MAGAHGTDKHCPPMESIATVGVFRADVSGICLGANKAWRELAGASHEEPCGRLWMEALHPEDRERVAEEWTRATANGLDFKSTFRFRHRDGTEKWILGVASPERDAARGDAARGDARSVATYLGTATDITEIMEGQQTQAREALRANEQYRLISDNTTDVITRHTHDGAYLYVSPSSEALFGYKPGELVGLGAREFIHPDDRDRVVETMRQLIGSGGTTINEYRHLKKNGSYVWVETSTRVLLDPVSGGIKDIICVIRDVSKRKQAQEALREAQHFAQRIIETTPNLIYVYDLQEQRNSFSNPGIRRILGYAPEVIEAFGPQVFAEIVHPDDLPAVLAHHARFDQARDGEVLEAKYRMRHADGRWILLHSRDVLFSRSEDGRAKQIIGTAEDITERARAEEALRKERDQNQRYLDIVNVLMIALNREGEVVLVNRKGCSILGYVEHELLGRNWFETCMPSRIRSTMQRNFARIISEEIPPGDYLEMPVLTKKGARRILAFRNVLMRDDDAHITGILGSAGDITEQKEAERALRESNDRYRALFESASDAISILDFSGRILEVNQVACKRLKYPRKMLLKKTAADITGPEHADRVPLWVDELRQKGHTVYETCHVRRDGVLIPVEVSGRVMKFRGTPAILCIMRDITERKKAEEEKQRLERQLMHSQKLEAIGTLAGGIAHDFNNILMAILGFTNLAMEKIVDPSIRADIEEVSRAAHRAADLVKQMLAFSRRNPEEYEPVETCLIVGEALKLLRASLPTTIQIRREIDPGAGAILADPTQLQQIVMNLCTNAYHAMRGGHGTLTVRLDSVAAGGNVPDLGTPRAVRLMVSDTGHGMDQTTIERIFDPFFTTKGVGEGTGLGLSVTHGIVRRCGGSIFVESELGKGSTFTIYFPQARSRGSGIIPDPHAGPAAPAAGEMARARDMRHVLYVDDEDVLARMGREALEGVGYKVSAFTNSRQALAAFKQHPEAYDVVVTDYTMPHMTGAQLAREIMRVRPEMPVVLVTGFSENITMESAQEMGIRRLVLKPIVPRVLATVLDEILGEVSKREKSHDDS